MATPSASDRTLLGACHLRSAPRASCAHGEVRQRWGSTFARARRRLPVATQKMQRARRASMVEAMVLPASPELMFDALSGGAGPASALGPRIEGSVVQARFETVVVQARAALSS